MLSIHRTRILFVCIHIIILFKWEEMKLFFVTYFVVVIRKKSWLFFSFSFFLSYSFRAVYFLKITPIFTKNKEQCDAQVNKCALYVRLAYIVSKRCLWIGFGFIKAVYNGGMLVIFHSFIISTNTIKDGVLVSNLLVL